MTNRFKYTVKLSALSGLLLLIIDSVTIYRLLLVKKCKLSLEPFNNNIYELANLCLIVDITVLSV
jgi:hypothetical protein